jgi:hypothetical protein
MATKEQTARLEAIAAVRLLARNRPDDALTMLNESEDPVELAHAACSMAAALLTTLTPGKAELILNNYTAAALRESA